MHLICHRLRASRTPQITSARPTPLSGSVSAPVKGSVGAWVTWLVVTPGAGLVGAPGTRVDVEEVGGFVDTVVVEPPVVDGEGMVVDVSPSLIVVVVTGSGVVVVVVSSVGVGHWASPMYWLP